MLILNIIDVADFKRGIFAPIPSFLRAKYQLIATVTFVTLFSLAFMLLSIPFSNNAWFKLHAPAPFFYTASFYAIALVFLIVSKVIMYKTRNTMSMNYLGYTVWNFAEALAICMLYTALSFLWNSRGIITLQMDHPVKFFFDALLYSFSSLIVPDFIAAMYFAIIDKNNTIRLLNYKNVVSDEPPAQKEAQKVALFDNNGILKMSVNLENLYLVESDDNYVKVWFLDNGGIMQRNVVRCRMKTVEESFKDSSIARCHRKYIVNLDKVKVVRKVADYCELELDNIQIPPIAVSRTYEESILARLGHGAI